MKMAKWLVRDHSDNTIYTYFSFEVLAVDVAVNGKSGVDIYELTNSMGKSTYNLTTVEEIRQKISSGEEAYKTWRLLNS